MSFTTLDPKAIRYGNQRTPAERKNKGHVTLGKPTRKGVSRMLFSVKLAPLFAGVTRVTVDHDPSEHKLRIKPARQGELGFAVVRVGSSATTGISDTTLRRHLGIRPTFTGRLPTTVKDGVIEISYKPALKKSA
jgi:hypothetical protein